MRKYWVTTASGFRIGPYDDYAKAYEAGIINFGFDGWVISWSTSG